MFLSELEIHGFKSFAQKTKFKFAEGVTAVVGPNGCGKSNVVDAIRWVLGEQKTTVLRSDSMENVIFNGAKNYKPLGMAEVTLTLENNRGVLSSDFSMVSVARRLFRSGDSKYLLNKANCRLKDINNLFMDTGMGPDSYSVIELKMVENLLSGKNEDRKGLLEEAAGITKYKIKRKETERKLNSVEQDLDRVLDIVSEVEKNVNSLSRQAAKTRKYNKLTEELKEKELIYYYLKYHSLKENSVGFEDNINNLKLEIENISKNLSDYQLKIDDYKVNKEQVESEYNSLRVEQNANNARLSDKKQEIAVAEVNLKNIFKDFDRLNDEIKRAENALQKNKENIENIAILKEEKSNSLIKINNDILEIKDKLNGSEKNLSDFINSINEKSKERSILSSKIREFEFKIKKHQDELNKLNRIKEELDLKKDELLPEIEIIKNKLIENNNSIDKLKNELNLKKDELNNVIYKKDELKIIIDDTNYKIKENKSIIDDKNRQLNFYNSLIDSESNSIHLLKNKEWNKNNYNTLADNIAVDKEYQRAIQTLLGEAAGSIIVEHIEEVKSADNILKTLKKGKQSLIILNNSNLKITKKEDIAGLIVFLEDAIRTNNSIKSYLLNKYSNCGIFNTMENAITALNDNKVDYALTVDGSLFSVNGDFIIGGEEKLKSNFGKLEKIELLNLDINELNDLILKLNNELEINNSLFRELNDDNIKQDIKKYEYTLNELQKEKNTLEVKNNSLINNSKFLEDNIAKNKLELINLEKDKIDFEEIDTLNNELNVINSQLFDLEKEEKEKRSIFNQFKETTQRLEIDKVRAENDLKRTNDELDDTNYNIQSIEKRITRLNTEINDNEKNKISLKNKLDISHNEIKLFINLQEELSNKIEIINSKLKDINLSIDSIIKEKNILNSKFNSLNIELHKIEINYTEINTQKKSISEQLYEKYEKTIESLEKPFDDFNQQELNAYIKEIKSKLQAIGSINFMALEEYEKENERFNFYKEQIDDLNKAKATLIQTIKEINVKATELLENTFNQVRVNFIDLFKTLFNEEAECDISLEGESILEADLKIWAKPPGKKPHSIDMLSGGEKTLTAIALLFAIYLVKPSPFCILDEVDAPLDDSNVDRFVNLIKRFSNNTQFLIVTHNKKTMEAADYLYGITQQEEGISKVVSVKLDKQDIEV